MNQGGDKAAWYLVYSRPQQEKAAKENLERQGYTVYLPMLRKRIRRGRFFHFRTNPLFPRYLFIRLSEGLDDWGPVRSTIGVVHLVKFGTMAATVPDQMIAGIQQQEVEPGLLELPKTSLKKGQRVRFVEGTLSGYEAIFEAEDNRERVIVLMNIVGMHSQLSVQRSSVVAIQDE